MEVPFDIIGTVVPGAHRGKELGFSTANIALPEEVTSAQDGIYAARVTVEGHEQPFMAAGFIGTAATFGDDSRRAEAHLLDYDEDTYGSLYGKEIAITFLYFIRKTKTFSNAEELVAAMNGDIRAVRRFFDSDHPSA